jgi:multiple sugar transport system substrate-binding protein
MQGTSTPKEEDMFTAKRPLAALVALMALLLPLLAACGGDSTPTPGTSGGTGSTGDTSATATTGTTGGSGSTDSGQKVTLTFWNGFTGPDRPAVEGLVKKWNDTHPNVQIQMDITPWDSLLQKLPSSLSTGQGPDLMGVSFTYMPQYAAAGYLKDLTPYMQAGSDLDPANFSQGLVDVMKYNGKFYGAPMNYATLLMYYNKDMFKDAGLDPDKPPATWDEWTDALKKLSKTGANGQQYGIGIGEHDTIPNWPILMWGNGGDVIKDGKPALSDPKSVEALKKWSDLVTKDKISPTGLTGAEADKLFETKKSAMDISGPWLTSGFEKDGLNFDVAPIPAGPAGPVTLSDSVLMMVNDKSKNADQAVEFVKFWNSKDSQIYWSQGSGFPAARLDLAKDPEIAKNKWVPKFAAVAPNARFYLPGQTKYSQIDTEVFVPMIQQITLGQKSVEDATKAADDQLAGMLK